MNLWILGFEFINLVENHIMKYLFVFLMVGMSISAFGQSKYAMHIDHSCSFDVDLVDTTVYSFASDAEADKALNRIMKLTGLPANFELKSATVPNASAVVKCDDFGCKRYILYSQEFMENLKDETRTNFAELAVLAHEIGHHLSGHTLTNSGSRYDLELEADKFAGFIMYKLGATITEVKQCFSNLSISGSSTHPPKSVRIAALSSGYYDAKRDGVTIDRTKSGTITSPRNNSNTKSNTTSSRKPNSVATVRIGRLEAMTQDFGPMKWDDAKKACADLGNGWRLPTKDELMFLIKNTVIQYGQKGSKGMYWSSTERRNGREVLAMFKTHGNSGVKYWTYKYKFGYIRPVRTIK